MNKISKLIFQPFIKLFITALFSTLAVIVLQLFLLYFTDFIGKGIDISEYILLGFYTATAALPYALPLAVMFSSIVAIGTLAENSEITALKAGGISLERIMKPLAIFGIFLGGLSFLGNAYFVPKAAVKFLALLYDIRSAKPEFAIKEGVFYDGIPGYSIRVGGKDDKTKILSDIMIYDHTRENSLPYLTIAKNGTITFQKDNGDLVIELFDGHNYFDIAEDNSSDYGERPNKFLKSNFKSQKLTISLDGFGLSKSGEELYDGNKRMKNMKRLLDDIKSFQAEIDEIETFVEKSFLDGVPDLYDDPLSEDDLEKDLNYYETEQAIEKNTLTGNGSENYNYDSEYIKIGCVNSVKNFKEYLQKCSNYEQNKVYYINEYKIEFHKMISWAISCITVMILGASLGAVIRKGGLGMPLVVSGFLIVIHYIIEISSEKWGLAGKIAPFHAAWAANYVIIPLSMLFYYLARKDAKIMDLDFYVVLYRKLLKKN